MKLQGSWFINIDVTFFLNNFYVIDVTILICVKLFNSFPLDSFRNYLFHFFINSKTNILKFGKFIVSITLLIVLSLSPIFSFLSIEAEGHHERP